MADASSSSKNQLTDCLRYRPVAVTAAQMREAAGEIESLDAAIAEVREALAKFTSEDVAVMARRAADEIERLERDLRMERDTNEAHLRACVAQEAEIERLRAALRTGWYGLMLDRDCTCRNCVVIREAYLRSADETTPALVVPPSHPLAGEPGVVVNRPLPGGGYQPVGTRGPVKPPPRKP